jgi:GNAT superfamily N-acetyltransferase
MADVLAAAFSTDPPLSFLVPEPDRREARLRRLFRALIPLYLEHGCCWVSDEPAGAAAWVAPGAWPFPPRVQAPVLGVLLAVFGRHPRRALAAGRAAERGHPREPHWYLDYIGVEPAAHGSGTGSALLRAGLERCDAEGMPAYLNAGSQRSRNLYLRHGFEVVERFELPHGGPPLWRMWREPR